MSTSGVIFGVSLTESVKCEKRWVLGEYNRNAAILFIISVC